MILGRKEGRAEMAVERNKELNTAIRKFANAIIKIIKNPIQFLKNLIKAVGGGFKQFGQNAGQYLKEGAMTWLKESLGIEGFDYKAGYVRITTRI